jgi:hypothetical protein
MQTYSMVNMVVTINGVQITGFADGDDVIQVKRRVDAASDKMGAGGDMAVSISTDKSAEITLRLLQTADSNSYLQTLTNSQEFLGADFVPVQIDVRDLRRLDEAHSTSGYMKKPAEWQRGAAVNTQEWVIVCENLSQNFGLGL